MFDELLRLLKLQEAKVLARFDELLTRMAERNAKYSEDEVAQDVAEARAELSRR